MSSSEPAENPDPSARKRPADAGNPFTQPLFAPSDEAARMFRHLAHVRNVLRLSVCYVSRTLATGSAPCGPVPLPDPGWNIDEMELPVLLRFLTKCDERIEAFLLENDEGRQAAFAGLLNTGLPLPDPVGSQ